MWIDELNDLTYEQSDECRLELEVVVELPDGAGRCQVERTYVDGDRYVIVAATS